jgi:hypothetical protein
MIQLDPSAGLTLLQPQEFNPCKYFDHPSTGLFPVESSIE